MNQVDKIKVALDIEGQKYDVGTLAKDGRQIYFKYVDTFLGTNLSLSPIRLSFSNQIQKVNTDVFEGIFGVFWDSLPDGWGRLLQDKYIQSLGINLNKIGALERLSMVGDHGPGALTYRPVMDESGQKNNTIGKLWDVYASVLKIYETHDDGDLWSIYKLGGSSGGARPKINCKYSENRDVLYFDNASYHEDTTDWIIKFPSSSDLKDIAHIEYAYFLMARECGLTISDSRLFYAKVDTWFFGTKRFDRTERGKNHFVSAAGIMHDNYRLSNLDYGHLMDCTFRLEKNHSSLEKVFRLACFNVLMHNKDDHSKNFGFLMDGLGHWEFSPCYDLTFSKTTHGYQSTSVLGISKNITEYDLKKLGKEFGIDNASMIIEQVKDVRAHWRQYAKDSNVRASSTKMIENIFTTKQ
jgi:serine/threonine-protein kinase HipA